MTAVCSICPKSCHIKEGEYGQCRARKNINGTIKASNYGKITSFALDPIEKKPLRRFHPGSLILSAGSYGCNMKCGFCQNSAISMSDGSDLDINIMTPEILSKHAEMLVGLGSIGLAYTYNEPFVGYEFVYDTCKIVRSMGMKNVIVTNGMINQEPLKKILPYVDAMNIDIKSFNEDFYKEYGGDLETVKSTIITASKYCHIELTTLVIPGKNDTESEMYEISKWISGIDNEIAFHVTRFFPCYKMIGVHPTDVNTIYKLSDCARQNLKFVYEGNI